MMVNQDEHGDRSLQEDYGWELAQLRQESAAQPAELQALERRLRVLQADRAPPVGAWRLGWALPALAAAAAVLAVWSLWPGAPGETALELDSPQWTSTQVHPDVQLQFEGRGHLQARDRAHEIAWRQGRLQVSVTPEQGIALTVQTAEARVSVVGTVFDVTRDRYGTTVSVTRGKVEVGCVGQTPRLLTPAEGPQVCLTRDPNALVERTRAQMEAGEPAAALETSTEGLQVAVAGSYPAAQLHTYRAELLLSTDPTAARHEAEAALATGQPAIALRARRAALAAALRGAGGCAVAVPHLTRLVTEVQPPLFDELALLADCVQETDPDRARGLWQQALESATDDAQRSNVRRRLSALE